METLNPLLASALEFMREGNVEAAEAGFGEAASACCEAYGEARHIFVCVHRFFEEKLVITTSMFPISVYVLKYTCTLSKKNDADWHLLHAMTKAENRLIVM